MHVLYFFTIERDICRRIDEKERPCRALLSEMLGVLAHSKIPMWEKQSVVHCMPEQRQLHPLVSYHK